eukprot:CAMPEP_0182522798 /NCGR_PEP_ID=MMETSP1323-20130603/567_1 /TAXON_ID=236787 /ORGANISM="Florenciella parvula, Strain RCC1693" /LENGTH=44 /DNA_ID= /DNA_START= /DNA_END= /DNA_ORIENTATION=
MRLGAEEEEVADEGRDGRRDEVRVEGSYTGHALTWYVGDRQCLA